MRTRTRAYPTMVHVWGLCILILTLRPRTTFVALSYTVAVVFAIKALLYCSGGDRARDGGGDADRGVGCCHLLHKRERPTFLHSNCTLICSPPCTPPLCAPITCSLTTLLITMFASADEGRTSTNAPSCAPTGCASSLLSTPLNRF